MSDWTVVSSNFDVLVSGTQKSIYNEDGTQVTAGVQFGQTLRGPVYSDRMCLISSGEPGDTGRLCVNDNQFILATILSDENTYQGVLGLGRGTKQRPSYPKLLHLQGVINEPIVSFNYEDPEDQGQASQIAFGEIIYAQIEGGKSQTNFYSNLGRDQWGLLIDDLLYQ